jgi:hydrogenase maturation protease
LKKSTLILGIGNEILKDDGIGPKIVSRLAGEYPASNFDYQTASLGGLELVELIRGYQRVILIDAINTGQSQVGEVSFFTPKDFKETLHLSNLHDISFLQALELGKHINIPIPEDILIIAIEIREDKVFGEEFTTELQQRYEQIYQSIKEYIKNLEH